MYKISKCTTHCETQPINIYDNILNICLTVFRICPEANWVSSD